jgi:hypothetical protein
MNFVSIQTRMPEDSTDDWLLLKVEEYSPAGFVVGYFYEGFKDVDGIDITEYVLKWARLPDYCLA